MGWGQSFGSGAIFRVRATFWVWAIIWVGSNQGQYFGSGVKHWVGDNILGSGQKVMGLGQNFGWGQNFSQSNVLGQGKILGQGHYLGSGQHSGSRAIIWIGSNILGEGKYFRSGVMFWVG